MPANRSSSPPRRYALRSLFGPGQDGMVSHTPHAAHLGIRVVETGPGFGVCALPFREELIGDPRRRVIFGGAITTLIDQASGLAVACAVEELTAIATIDLRVDYLRAAEPDVELYARSDCYRLTRNVAFVRAVAYERTADDPFASALGTFMLGANRSDSPVERLLRPQKGGGEGIRSSPPSRTRRSPRAARCGSECRGGPDGQRR